MYKTITGIIVIAVVIVIVASYIYQSPQFQSVFEDERAQFLAERALDEYYSKGSAAFSDITNNPVFHDEFVYTFVIDKSTGTIMAHNNDRTLVGKDVTKLFPIDGDRMGPAILEEATTDGTWIEYKWENPETNNVVFKKLWVKLFEGHIFGAVDNY